MRRAYVGALLLLGMLAHEIMAQETATRAEDEAAIRRVVDAFIATREDADAESLRALLTEDIDQQVTSGQRRDGREEVVAGSLATTRLTGGERRIVIDKIRFLSDDIAIADGSYDITGRNDGTDRHYRTTLVLKKEGAAWRITAVRNMMPTR